LRQREEVQEMLRFPRRGEVGVTEQTTAFANARIFDGTSAELREGCVRVAAGTIAEVAEGPGPGDQIVDCRGRTIVPGLIDARTSTPAAPASA
jgi:imidazolonepropionase-like amidohydrolase